ncbi:MAG: 3-hydroxyacyl-ACP dehydratase FabZ [Xanthomonadaceae bacterium]|nr:3-hydroxyacyl-ACP dehydratase FabZ [Xanthomonadaceae bacterium]MDE1884920.1 3-hydroxyacyl-ACP dehydratase FabZ [Xanthomonadaceae bacterium]MDE1961064.1 3-hydroxyacyl-ACP dehydratase FabZ [Xanthomonadaceae bacterium]MDE2083345.1 3-hydroxyacyl-ACP dehydratase FabZ [Xanthomonadaceae bacterium]MDE2258609.1 3-hydroxyacyl-ACP dehydratase FabZ [Xanthomonadaceae bacterium]
MTESRSAIALPMDIERIMALLPHRYPFLLVDRVVEFEHAKRLVALKNVTINEPFFQGHFPGHPVMPGVLIIEAMAQASGLLVFLSTPKHEAQPMYYLVKVDNAKFTQMVVPGDQLTLHVELKRMLRGMGLFACRALVAGKQVAEAELLCAGRSGA